MDDEIIDDILDEAESKMTKSAGSLRTAFNRIRTNRATPELLDPIEVDYYGSMTPIKHVATIAADGMDLSIAPFEKSLLSAIEKAIYASDLGMTPNNNGEKIYLSMPPLTQENRQRYVRQAKNECEKAKVACRNIRREAIQFVRELAHDKDISEDDGRIAETEIQEITDKHVQELEAILEVKEQDLLKI